MKKRKLLILLLPILFLACSLPPYNEKLSLALISTKKMKQEAVIGPLHMWKGEFEGVENDGKGNYWTEGYGWYELRNQDRTTLNYQVQSIKGGDFINVVIRSDFPLDLPADLENAFYYYYPDTSTGFISFFSASASAKIWVISTHRYGEELYSFALGGLHFVYELYFDGVYRMFFTMPCWDDQRLSFTVYSIPTGDLAALD